MPVGTGVETLSNIPSQPFVTDPASFFQMTEKNVLTARQFSTPGPGQFAVASLLQSGIVSKLVVHFEGTLTVAGGTATTSDEWPYNLLKDFKLSANGQTDLFSCSGIDLDVRRNVQYPAYTDHTDAFAGSVGGGDSVVNGATTLALTWEVPVAIDDTSLIGAVYAQSASSNFVTRVTQALNTDLFSAIPGTVTIAGTWSIQETVFDIPFDSQGRIVVPDLSRLHGFNSVEAPFTNTGEVRMPLVRSAGQLDRIIVSVRSAANNRLSGQPNAASTKKLDALRLEYGGNQRPYVFNPVALQLALNNQHYGAPPPYDRIVLDFIKENPIRDIILMQGVTELAIVPTVGSGVTVSAGMVRVTQETLF